MIGFMYHPLKYQLSTSLNRELCKFCTGIMPNKNVEWTVLRGVVMRSNDIDNITDRHNNTHRITGRQGHRPATTNVFCSAVFSFLDEIFLVFRTDFCFSGKVFTSQPSCGGYYLIDVVFFMVVFCSILQTVWK